MKHGLLRVLKVALPLALGLWLGWYFYAQLDPTQRHQLHLAFVRADFRWLLLTLVLGWLSHVIRAWRWGYLLDPMGYKPGFWNRYHAVMIGYFMNLLVQRVGEASRAVSIYRTDGVPFEKGFGTILAERVIDTLILLLIVAVTVALQFDKLELIQARIAAFRAGQSADDDGLSWWVIALVALVAIAIIVGAWLLVTRPVLRARLMDAVRGFGEGFRSVSSTPHRGLFLLHSLLIWVLYVGMFYVGFLCLPATSAVPLAGVFAGFIAGSVGIILVQGGIGVYPAFVAVIVSVYMPSIVGDGGLHPEALALGWLLWAVQTVMLVVLGGLSLLLAGRTKPSS